MGSQVIKVENLSKQYRLGAVGSKTIKEDLYKVWYSVTGKSNPYINVGDENDRTKQVVSNYVWSLKDINFEINEGEVVGIIGKNGAGKSTLLKLLSKITAPTKGTIKIKGRIASLLEVGTGFHPELTGRENLYLNGAILGMKKAEINKRFDEILSFAEVEKYIDTPVKRYSSGMYVRLAFAIAAHLEPEILIVDEVLSVGDSEFQKKCLGKMKDVSSQGRTILFVSHNIPSIQNLCTHGIVLNKGRVEFPKEPINNSIKHYLEIQKDSTNVKLSERTDRKGNGKLKFVDYKLIDEKNNYVTALISGQRITFRLFFETQENISLNNVSIAISITSSNGTLISVLCNEYLNKTFDEVDNKNYFDCIIYKLPFMEDTFSLNIMANNSLEIFDWIENAIKINVENGDFFGTGRIIEPTHKSILIEHDWNYNRSQDK